MAANLLSQRKIELLFWRQLNLQTFKNFTGFNEFFQRPFMRKYCWFSTEAAHLPLRSVYGLWVPLTIFFEKRLRVAFSKSNLCFIDEVLLGKDGQLSLAPTMYQKGVKRNFPGMTGPRESYSWPYFMTASGKKSAAMRTRVHNLIISSLKKC